MRKDWQDTSNPFFPYSRKIREVYTLFQKAQTRGTGNIFCFIIDANTHKSNYFTLWDYAQISDINNFIKRDYPNQRVLIMMDLRENFDLQIRSGFMDPTKLESWETLKSAPMDCIHPEVRSKTVPHDKVVTPIPHLDTLSAIWSHPEPQTLPPKKYIGVRPREHLSLVAT